MDRTEGIAKLTEIICDCLDLDAGDVAPEAQLIHDLGVDSLDFIDLAFTVEDAFGVKLRGDDFDLLGLLDLSRANAVTDGKVNPEIIRSIQDQLPDLIAVDDVDNVTPYELFGLITVEVLWRVVALRLAAAAA